MFTKMQDFLCTVVKKKHDFHSNNMVNQNLNKKVDPGRLYRRPATSFMSKNVYWDDMLKVRYPLLIHHLPFALHISLHCEFSHFIH